MQHERSKAVLFAPSRYKKLSRFPEDRVRRGENRLVVVVP